ncbi:cytochrome C [Photobacterium rosenbergii]|uniref:Cytochrome C n=1 Tax=Photobacterium rosenbergii TaxID=294936 RepID=A0A2T3NJH3_9GAMM|nr:cytochrome c [Photobacterium rosenbergii]PSW15666.1 cytochrome C [Photobacterium rosenbergii]
MMMKQRKSVVVGVALGLGLSFSTVSLATSAGGQQDTQSSAAQSIEQRQQAFVQIESGAKLAGKTLDNKQVDWEGLEQISQELHQSSVSLHSLFPEGSQQGSKAKEKVWKDKAKFERSLNQMDAGFEQLYQATLTADKKVAQQGLKSAQSTCKACHRQYRSRW